MPKLRENTNGRIIYCFRCGNQIKKGEKFVRAGRVNNGEQGQNQLRESRRGRCAMRGTYPDAKYYHRQHFLDAKGDPIYG